MAEGKFCLKWDEFHSNIACELDRLRQDEELVDVTLCCEGQRIRAHRMMLCASSSYLREILRDHPCQQMVLFLRDTPAADLSAIVEFMYKGSVSVPQSQMASFMKTAETLRIRGLSGNESRNVLEPAASPLSSSRPAAAGPGASEQRPSLCEPQRTSSRMAEQRRASVQEIPVAPPVAPLSAAPSLSPPPTAGPSSASQSWDVPQPAVDRLQVLESGREEANSARLVKVEKMEMMEDDVVGADVTYESGGENGYGSEEREAGEASSVGEGKVPFVSLRRLRLPSEETPEPSQPIADPQPGPSQQLVDDEIPKDTAPYRCDRCGFPFRTQHALAEHVLTWHGPGLPVRRHTCHVCGYATDRASSLAAHKRTHTGEQTPHQCDVCGRRFNQASSLAKHKRVHTGEKPFKCEVCGKAFRDLTTVTRHRRVHTGEKPHQCEECGKTFTRIRGLTLGLVGRLPRGSACQPSERRAVGGGGRPASSDNAAVN